MRFRPYSPADREQCLELYRLNEPGRFPEGVLEDYNRVLEGTGYILVLEQGGRIIATGGLHHITGRNMTMFWCGLVHPDFQGRGVGTTLFYARIALLNTDLMLQKICIAAVQASFGFYQRFGFAHIRNWKDKQGTEHPIGFLTVCEADIRLVRSILAKSGIEVPLKDMTAVPFRSPEAEAVT